MADNQEFYRLNLVLKMDDRLSNAMARIDEKVGKFEQRVQKTQGTVDKLGASKAEPKIAADTSKAESQIERTNALLERIEKKIVRPKVEAEDRTAPKVNSIRDRLQSLTSKAWKVSVGLKDDVTSKLDRMKGAMTSPLGIVGMGAATVGVGSLLVNSAQKSMDFSAQVSSIKALTQLPDDQIDQVREKALQLGKDTQFSALEAAKGMTELLKAGIDVKDVMGDASQAALDLATAGELSLPEAAEVMSTAMNAFDMNDAAHAADILAGAANASATDVHELRYSLAMCSAVASGVGMSFEDTNTALAVFASKGLKGSDAGTSLKTMFARLEPMTKSQYAAFSELNLLTEEGTSLFYDQAGKMKSLADIADLLHDRMSNLTNEKQQRLLYEMFGSDAIRGGTILLNKGADGVNKMYEAMTHFTASQVAIEKMNSAKGAVERLRGSFETFQIKAMKPFEPVIAKIASSLDGYFADSADGASAKMKGLADDVLYFMECLENNEAFQQMDWGDKIVYVLDRMMEAVDKWVSGPGGEQFGKVLTKLAEIGMRAFMAALLGLMKGSLDALMHGNFAGAAGLAFGASLLGGGTLLGGMYKGAKGLGGLAIGGGGKAGGVYDSALALAKEGGAGGLSARLSAAKLTLDTSPLGKAFSGAADVIEKFGKRIAIIGAAVDGYRLYKSDDKLKTGAGIGGGWLGALAGAKAGAAAGGSIGAVFGGIGAAPGALIGGLAGGVGGYFVGEKIGDGIYARLFGKGNAAQENGLNGNMFNVSPSMGGQQPFAFDSPATAPFPFGKESQNTMQPGYTPAPQTLLQKVSAEVDLSGAEQRISDFKDLCVSSFSAMLDDAGTNMRRLEFEVETGAQGIYEAISSWVGNAVSYAGSQFDALVDRVSGAMQSAKQAIWSATPTAIQTGLTWASGKLNLGDGHANGGIFDQEHIARFAEGNKAEAVIPLDSSMRSQGMSIWQQAGQMLGINSDLFANMGSPGYAPAAAMAGGGMSGSDSSGGGDSSSFNFNGMNIHIGSSKNEEDMALSIGYRILAEIKQGLENKE